MKDVFEAVTDEKSVVFPTLEKFRTKEEKKRVFGGKLVSEIIAIVALMVGFTLIYVGVRIYGNSSDIGDAVIPFVAGAALIAGSMGFIGFARTAGAIGEKAEDGLDLAFFFALERGDGEEIFSKRFSVTVTEAELKLSCATGDYAFALSEIVSVRKKREGLTVYPFSAAPMKREAYVRKKSPIVADEYEVTVSRGGEEYFMRASEGVAETVCLATGKRIE